MLMLVPMTLTFFQCYSGSAEENIHRRIISTTKQVNLYLSVSCGSFVQLDGPTLKKQADINMKHRRIPSVRYFHNYSLLIRCIVTSSKTKSADVRFLCREAMVPVYSSAMFKAESTMQTPSAVNRVSFGLSRKTFYEGISQALMMV